MQWSKLKKRVESFFASSVVGRVELRVTNYRKSHDWEGRAWITIDKEEICNFCTWKYFVEHGKLKRDIQEANNATEWWEPSQRSEYYSAIEQADDILEKQGLVSQYYFEEALETYLQLPIETALASDNFIHRSLAILDRRTGKRRLSEFETRTDEPTVVARLLEFRKSLEGLTEKPPNLGVSADRDPRERGSRPLNTDR
ncbi:MAG: hypothetical protein MUC56_18405 [Thermoanaerobaculales bacterium]|nr:hypothetical protein [Thermoanaerobaculales bacterium]